MSVLQSCDYSVYLCQTWTVNHFLNLTAAAKRSDCSSGANLQWKLGCVTQKLTHTPASYSVLAELSGPTRHHPSLLWMKITSDS